MSIILASSSPYRAAQLKQLGINPEIIPANIDETVLSNESAEATAARLAKQKAKAALSLRADSSQPILKSDGSTPDIIIGSDQVACLNNEQLGKPLTHANAVIQLSKMSGQQVFFYTALCVFSMEHQTPFQHTDITRVTFRNLSRLEIEQYLYKEQPYHCAGSFKCEGLGISLFQSIETKDPSALIGLPLIAVNLALLNFGVNLLEK